MPKGMSKFSLFCYCKDSNSYNNSTTFQCFFYSHIEFSDSYTLVNNSFHNDLLLYATSVSALNMQLLQMNQSQNAVNAGIPGQAAPPQRLQPQQTALQKLQKEKELLRQRQEELNRQVSPAPVSEVNNFCVTVMNLSFQPDTHEQS